ncbi:uncharacterized protein LOC131680474 [Topomyia yanbarensis]|uniref:uncharacterized protein LOC131680474 n=1 Tax=Topomyia yanbarensis TaxID=2498891 RepID=UPI00273BEC00|nr:uncharacterized protein LOC131680474 [Topomyia yanbarensis]
MLYTELVHIYKKQHGIDAVQSVSELQIPGPSNQPKVESTIAASMATTVGPAQWMLAALMIFISNQGQILIRFIGENDLRSSREQHIRRSGRTNVRPIGGKNPGSRS